MGTGTNWPGQGQWRPMGHAEMSMVRTMCARKPYLFPMNTDFDPLGPYVERHLQRSLFCGMALNALALLLCVYVACI